jgi:prepilin-type N-terminal cleavage/methylation domain-containing protein/prepilin-type processing-associated H-X9-DG protein
MNRTRNNAFTLIELLIVIAIITLLVSISLPALSAVRRMSRQAVCLSNLRHCGSAAMEYVSSNRGRYFPYLTPVHTPQPYTPCYFWGTDSDPVNTEVAPWMKYLGSPDLLLCPELPWGSYVPQGARVAEPTTCFAYNKDMFSGRVISTIRSAGELILLADAAEFNTWSAGGVLRNSSYLEPPAGRWACVPTNHFRHYGTTTDVLFADGHAESMSPAGELDENNLGFVGERNDPYYIQK